MNKKIVHFINCYGLSQTHPNFEMILEYTIVDASYVDTAEEEYQTQTNKIYISISDTLARVWYLNSSIDYNEGLLKVLTEYASRYISKKIQLNILSQEEQINLLTSNTENPKCRFNPKRLSLPKDLKFEVEYDGGLKMFDELMNDKVALVKQNGEQFDNIVADVQPNIIFINDTKLPIEEGDILVRKLPNGLSENYIVLDRGYYEEFIDIPAHYQVKVHKESSMHIKQNSSAIYNTNFNAPVYGMQVGNGNSQFNSITNQDINNDLDKLREFIKNAVISDLDKEDIYGDLDRIAELSRKERSEGVIEKANKRLESIIALCGNAGLIYQQINPHIESIRKYFNI